MKNPRFWAKIARFMAFLEALFMVAVAAFVVISNPHLALNEAMISFLLLMMVLAGSVFALFSLSHFLEGRV